MHSRSRLCSPPESVPTSLSASSPGKPKAPRLSRASCGVQRQSYISVSSAVRDGSLNRLLLADDKLHERALAGAVVAYYCDSLAALDDGAEAGKERAALKALGEPVHCDDLVAGEVPLLE